MDGHIFRLKPFNPKKIKPNRAMFFIGKKGTGKTTLMEDMLYYHRRIPDGMVMTATNSQFWAKHVPDSFVFDSYDADYLRRLAVRQQKKEEDTRPSTFLVMDDIIYDKAIGKDKTLRGVLMNQRHWKISLLFAMQYCLDIPLS